MHEFGMWDVVHSQKVAGEYFFKVDEILSQKGFSEEESVVRGCSLDIQLVARLQKIIDHLTRQDRSEHFPLQAFDARVLREEVLSDQI